MREEVESKKIESYEKQLVEQEKEIISLEKKIEKKEDEIIKVEKKIFSLLGGLRFFLNGISKSEASFLRTGFLRRFSRHKLLYFLTIVVSVVLIWRGIWSIADSTPGIANPIVSILAGIAILWIIDSVSELI